MSSGESGKGGVLQMLKDVAASAMEYIPSTNFTPKDYDKIPFLRRLGTVYESEMAREMNPEQSKDKTFMQGKFFAPVIMSPLTDPLAPLSLNWSDKCFNLQVQALECIEFYGAQRGRDICRDYYDDFMECTYGTKQALRNDMITHKRNQRYADYLRGKVDKDDVYAKMPPAHVRPNPSWQSHDNFKDFN